MKANGNLSQLPATAHRIERRRHNINQRANVIGLVSAALIGTPVLVVTKSWVLALAFACSGWLAGFVGGRRTYLRDIINEYKLYVVKPFIEERFSRLLYMPNYNFSRQKIVDSGLFQFRLPSIDVEDMIVGEVEGARLEMTEVRIYKDSDAVDKSLHFQGVFGTIDSPITTPSPVYLYSKDYRAGPGFFHRKSMEKGFQKVEVESGEFNAAFDLWTQDEVDAHFCLPTNLQEILTVLHRQIGNGLALGFVEDRLHFSFQSNVDLFEPDDADFCNLQQLEWIADQVEAIIHLVNSLTEQRKAVTRPGT